MIDFAVISGSGFYDFPGLEGGEEHSVSTKYGECILKIGSVFKRKIAFIARHGKNHSILPNNINHRANLMALKKIGVQALLSTTVCGVLDRALPLTRLVVFDDIHFPDNRLPSGEACTIYDEIGDKNRGHYIFDKPFSERLRQQVINASDNPLISGVYAYVNGPRFNSKSEIRSLQQYASFVSQTAGPEVVLAGELEIPCALVGFGVDYANGVSEKPTPVDVLRENLIKSKSVFVSLIKSLLKSFKEVDFEGFIYRFE